MENMRSTTMVMLAGSALLAAALVATACGRGTGTTGYTSATPAFLDVQLPSRPPTSAETIAHGHELFAYNCAHCHGDHGEGDGYGAPFLVPQPRNFVTAKYKFR